jgi:hypothetical protein
VPSIADIPTTWPPPVDVVLSDSKDQISAVRVTLLRAVTLKALAAFIQGSGVGAASTQEGRFAVYTHDAGANRPDALLEESAPFFIGRDDPIRGIQPALLTAPLDLDPGVYWLAIHLAPIVGQGKVQVRGLTAGGRTILQAPALYSSGLPDPFPPGGTAGAGRLGVGGILTPQPLGLAGAIVGQFVVGDGTLVGQGPASFNDSQLVLTAKPATANIYTDFHLVTMAKPSLDLRGKLAVIVASSTPVLGKSSLILSAKPFIATIPAYAHMAKAQLILQGKAVALQSDSSVSPGKAKLILTGKKLKAGEVILLPTTPVSADLVPSVPGSLDLTPSTPASRDLTPTTEEFR